MMVSIMIGSDSDLNKIKEAVDVFKEFGVKYEVKILSAHRTPQDCISYVKEAEKNKTEVFICGAGLSAHLPGVVAAHTICPVIGVPFDLKLGGLDSLLSMVNMPPGIPVATVGIDASKNAAILAIEILSIKYSELKDKLIKFREKQRDKIIEKNKQLTI